MIQLLLQLRTSLLQMIQHGPRRSHSQRMTDESAGKKCHAGLRHRRVAELPWPAVQRVHELGLPGQHSNRQSSADYFSIRDQIRAHVKPSLRSAYVSAETRYHFVENQGNASLFGKLAEMLQIGFRLQRGMAALHGLHQNCGYGIRLSSNGGERLFGAVVQHQNICCGFRRNAGSDGTGAISGAAQ